MEEETTFRLRPVRLDDAEFLWTLRSMPETAKFLAKTREDVAGQRKWLEEYFRRHAARQEYYFIIEAKNLRYGAVRLYQIDYLKRTFTIGSWITDPAAPMIAGGVGIAMAYDFGFHALELECCYFEVMKDNRKVAAFHRHYAEELSPDAEFLHFRLSREQFCRSLLINYLPDNSIAETARVAASVFLARGVQIDEGSQVKDECRIGFYSQIGALCHLEIGTTVGNNVILAPGVTTFVGTDGGRCLIEDGVQIGANAALAAVRIGRGAQVAPGSTVLSDVPPYAIVSGQPAEIVGYVDTILISPELRQEKDQSEALADIYEIPSFSDLRGHISVVEFAKSLPCEIKRIFYTYKDFAANHFAARDQFLYLPGNRHARRYQEQ